MKKKSIITLLVVGVLCVGMTGCGNTDSSSDVTTTTTTTTAATTTTTTEPTTTSAEVTSTTSVSDETKSSVSSSGDSTTTTTTAVNKPQKFEGLGFSKLWTNKRSLESIGSFMKNCTPDKDYYSFIFYSDYYYFPANYGSALGFSLGSGDAIEFSIADIENKGFNTKNPIRQASLYITKTTDGNKVTAEKSYEIMKSHYGEPDKTIYYESGKVDSYLWYDTVDGDILLNYSAVEYQGYLRIAFYPAGMYDAIQDYIKNEGM